MIRDRISESMIDIVEGEFTKNDEFFQELKNVQTTLAFTFPRISSKVTKSASLILLTDFSLVNSISMDFGPTPGICSSSDLMVEFVRLVL